MNDDEAAKYATWTLTDASLAVDEAEYDLRRAAVKTAVNRALRACAQLTVESAEHARAVLRFAVHELHAADVNAAHALANLTQVLVAAQFEAAGIDRLAALGAQLYEDGEAD